MKQLTTQLRALQMLAGCPQGVTEDFIVLAHGFDRDIIGSLVRIKLATLQRQTVRAGGQVVEVSRITITDAGRQALKGKP
jgi:hypothetical protein